MRATATGLFADRTETAAHHQPDVPPAALDRSFGGATRVRSSTRSTPPGTRAWTLRDAAERPESAWLASPRPFRHLGAVASDDAFRRVRLAQSFDALL